MSRGAPHWEFPGGKRKGAGRTEGDGPRESGGVQRCARKGRHAIWLGGSEQGGVLGKEGKEGIED